MTALYGGQVRCARQSISLLGQTKMAVASTSWVSPVTVRVMCADIASRLMQASPAGEETILGSLVDDTEAVVATEHALCVSISRGAEARFTSHTQETRVRRGPSCR